MSSEKTDHAANAEEYRVKAAEMASAMRTTRSLKQGSEARRSQQAYAALADNEEWLAKHSDKVV